MGMLSLRKPPVASPLCGGAGDSRLQLSGWATCWFVGVRNDSVEIRRRRCSDPSIRRHPFLKFARVRGEHFLQIRGIGHGYF